MNGAAVVCMSRASGCIRRRRPCPVRLPVTPGTRPARPLGHAGASQMELSTSSCSQGGSTATLELSLNALIHGIFRRASPTRAQRPPVAAVAGGPMSSDPWLQGCEQANEVVAEIQNIIQVSFYVFACVFVWRHQACRGGRRVCSRLTARPLEGYAGTESQAPRWRPGRVPPHLQRPEEARHPGHATRCAACGNRSQHRHVRPIACVAWRGCACGWGRRGACRAGQPGDRAALSARDSGTGFHAASTSPPRPSFHAASTPLPRPSFRPAHPPLLGRCAAPRTSATGGGTWWRPCGNAARRCRTR